MNKAQLSLEYIVKVMILLVVVTVVIGMIINFSDKIKIWVSKLFPREKPPPLKLPERINQTTFSSGEIATYIESCLLTMSSLSEDEQEDIDCYILTANQVGGFSSVTILDIRASLSSETSGKTEINADFNRDYVIIRYQDVGNKIIVSN